VIRRAAAIAGALLAASLVLALIGATFLVMGPLPSRRGRVAIPGLKASADARFDRQGVPHIRAVLETDAWRVLGFIHASDRLFQMELRRRAAEGRLAELFGAAAVAMDREARVNGYSRSAQRDWDGLQEPERAALEAYADGVNAFLQEEVMPIEIRALSLAPEPWTPIDSLAFARMMENGLSVADAPEQAAFDDAVSRGLDKAVALMDASQPGPPQIDREIAALLAGFAKPKGPAPAATERATAGSNAWALSGRHTATGKPLLAGDPHLAAERPGVWYAAHLTSADGLNAIGLTLPGTPGFIIGHDGRVAWSLTMHQADDSDLYLEQVDWEAKTYRRDGGSVPLQLERETIHVKDGADAIVEVARTVHGPIVERLDGPPGYALSRAFAPADVPQGPRAFLEAPRARNRAELVAAWSRYAGPSVNVCWAESTGAVGMKVAGAIPRRRSGDGRFPVPGWISAYDWDGTIPAGSLPADTQDRDGLVASANDDWSASGSRLPYPGVFAEPDRVRRARELGSAVRAATVADMRAMQNDVYSPYAARIVAVLSRMSFLDPGARRAQSVLSSWDARAETRGASRLFFAFVKEARKEAGGPGVRVTWSMLERMIDGSGAQAFWGDPATPRAAARTGAIERALARAIETVEHEDGKDPARWSWGKLHRLTYEHPFASVLPTAIADGLRFGPIARPGEWHTLDVSGFPLRGDGYDVTEIPSARLIVDLAAPDASRFVLPLGQSGQLFDRHASDQLHAWSTGRDFPLPFSVAAVDAATISTVRFVPAD
jgi:penicillin amidase